jgi:hypothetical protein
MGCNTDRVFGFYFDMCVVDVGDCFEDNYYGGFQMGVESIGYVACVILFIL